MEFKQVHRVRISIIGSVFGCTLLVLTSCGKANFIDEVQGKWKVVEVNYITDSDTIIDYPADMAFIFSGNTYQTLINDTVNEFGSFYVNFVVTEITFLSSLGYSVMRIEEKTDIYQHWQSKNKIIDFYLGFKLDKIE